MDDDWTVSAHDDCFTGPLEGQQIWEGAGGEGGFVSMSAKFLPGSDGPATAFKDHPETTSKLFEASKDNYLVLFVSGTPIFHQDPSFKLILIF